MSAERDSVDVLRTPQAGARVIRGGALRAGGYGVGVLLGAATSVFLLRGLGVEDFGRYATVAALLAIVSTVSDAGLVAVGARELAVLSDRRDRAALLEVLVAMRIVLTVVGVAGAVVFALVAGYDRVMVWGTVLGGLGVLLVNTQATMTMPLSVGLRLGAITAFEVLKQALTLLAVAALALAGASLLPYFAVQVLVGAVVLALTPAVLGSLEGLRPALRRGPVFRLVREGAPVAVALAMNVLYLRLLVILVSLLDDETETGLYGTAFRVVELLIGVPVLVLGVALPLLAVAGAEDRERLRYGLQAMTEVALVASLGLALATTVLAEPVIRLLGGADYADAAPMLQIQAWALVPLFLGQVLSLALLSLRRQRDLALANAAAVVTVLAVGLALIPGAGGEGAAVAGIAAEVVLAAGLFTLLFLADRRLAPRYGFAWRPLAALAAGLATLLVPLPAWLDAALALGVFAAVALAVRAVPAEVFAALRRRAPGDSP